MRVPKDPAARKGQRSVSDAVALASELDEELPLPRGLTFRSERERVLWGEFTRARVPSGWRSIDLHYLAIMVRSYAENERLAAAIAKSGRIVQNKRGTPIVNPLLSLFDSQLRLQLAIGSRLGVLQSTAIGPDGADARDVAAAALARAQMRKAVNDDAEDLIPR